MRARTLAALMAVLLLSWPVAAQDQRGTIEGTVKDASGAVLPGVTVEAKTTTGVVQSTTTDASGGFRFPSLPPGLYEVSAHLASFSPQKFTDVNIGLGQIKRLEFALTLAGVQETVSVTAESPLVDIRQNARQTNIRAEQIDLLPRGRDFTSLVTQAPGANQEVEARWHLDRRREREREPLHHRWHRDDQPAERPLRQEPDRRLRRRSAGQVERLHGRVRRRHGRRHQRDHQERLERVPRLRPLLHPGLRYDRRVDADAAAEAGQLARSRVHHLSRGQQHADRTRLLARWSDRRQPGVVLRRLPAGADGHRRAT